MDTDKIIREIDNSHVLAHLALKIKDFDGYIDGFSDDLEYKQLDGKTIDKSKLSSETRKYFGRIKSYNSTYHRVKFKFENDIFVEELVQKATVTIRIFILFSKKWTVERQGIYKWKKEKGTWKILGVDITSEKLQ